MRKSFLGLARIALSLVLVFGLASCSKEDSTRIFGHWRADRFKLQGLNLPLGPEIVFKEHELYVPEGDIHIPINSISAKGNEIIVDIPPGLGLSFNFEGDDRMSFDVPFAGKIYYQRITDVLPLATTTAVPNATGAKAAPPAKQPIMADRQPQQDAPAGQIKHSAPTTAAPVFTALELVRQAELKMQEEKLADAQNLLLRASKLADEHPMVDYNLAILRMRQSDDEAAIRHLYDAFRHGFLAFGLLDASPDLAPLKSDVRYQMLVARYR
jgi:hypothetical protein